MKPSSQPSKTPFRLSDSIQRKLNMYALAASAAGVGVLALFQPAEAKIIYTKTNVNVFKSYPPGFSLDLNNDGTADFVFIGFAYFSQYWGSSDMRIAQAAPSRTDGSYRSEKGGGAAALRAGVPVGPAFSVRRKFVDGQG
jgi:hypothetical protein